jgi:hypothetical protein
VIACIAPESAIVRAATVLASALINTRARISI